MRRSSSARSCIDNVGVSPSGKVVLEASAREYPAARHSISLIGPGWRVPAARSAYVADSAAAARAKSPAINRQSQLKTVDAVMSKQARSSSRSCTVPYSPKFTALSNGVSAGTVRPRAGCTTPLLHTRARRTSRALGHCCVAVPRPSWFRTGRFPGRVGVLHHLRLSHHLATAGRIRLHPHHCSRPVLWTTTSQADTGLVLMRGTGSFTWPHLDVISTRAPSR